MPRFVRKGHQAEANAHVPLPVRDGVAPSYLWITETRAGGMLRFLEERFEGIAGPSWQERLARGDVVDAKGAPLHADSPVRQGMRIWYYRELEHETPIPFEETILFQDEHLLVVDKPHFLPMIPTGRFLRETLLVRLKQRLTLPHLTPIHRLDRETAGVVIFSHNLATRGLYQSMFQKRSVRKVYEAAARRDDVTAFEFYAEDIVWDISNSGRAAMGVEPVYEGHEGVRQYWREVLSVFGEIDFEVEELVDAGDQVLAVIREREVGRASGAPVESTHFALWTVADGKVAAVDLIIDREKLNRVSASLGESGGP